MLIIAPKTSLYRMHVWRYDFGPNEVRYVRRLGTNVLYDMAGDKLYVSYMPVVFKGEQVEEEEFPEASNKIEIIDVESGKSDKTMPVFIKYPRWYYNNGLRTGRFLYVSDDGKGVFLQGALSADPEGGINPWCIYDIDSRSAGAKYYKAPLGSRAHEDGMVVSKRVKNGIAFLEKQQRITIFSFDKKAFTELPYDYPKGVFPGEEQIHREYVHRLGMVAFDIVNKNLLQLTDEDLDPVPEKDRVLISNIEDPVRNFQWASGVKRCIYAIRSDTPLPYRGYVIRNWETGKVLLRWRVEGNDAAFRCWFSSNGAYAYVLGHNGTRFAVYEFVNKGDGESLEAVKRYELTVEEMLGIPYFHVYGEIIPLP